MNNIIPYPRVGRRESNANPYIKPIPTGEFLNAVHFIWDKFNVNNGFNLAAFRHNLRDYYDEAIPITTYELHTIRSYLSDPEFQICVSPAGKSFRWDNRGSSAERKCIYIDEIFYILFSQTLTESQTNAVRLIFMDVILHCLGDYFTAWAQPNIDLSPDQSATRFEGGMKTEYAVFGGFIGGHMSSDDIHYESAHIQIFNAQNQQSYYTIPDHLAREVYNSDQFFRFSETGLNKSTIQRGPTNTIRQLDICCGYHRLVWKPIQRPPPEQQPSYNQPGYFGQPPPTGIPWYPPQPQPQQGGYPTYSGPTFVQPPTFTPPGNYGSGGPYGPVPPGPGILLIHLTYRKGNQTSQWIVDGTYGLDSGWIPPVQQQNPSNQEDPSRRHQG